MQERLDGGSLVVLPPPPELQELEKDCKPGPHLRGIAMLAGGLKKEPGPVLPSGMSLFPTGFDINEVIIVRVYAPVPQPLCISSPSNVVPSVLTFLQQEGIERKGEKKKGFPLFNFGFDF